METLPKVGSDVEALQDDMSWVQVRCVAHYEGFAVCVKDEGDLSADVYELELLRPIGGRAK